MNFAPICLLTLIFCIWLLNLNQRGGVDHEQERQNVKSKKIQNYNSELIRLLLVRPMLLQPLLR